MRISSQQTRRPARVLAAGLAVTLAAAVVSGPLRDPVAAGEAPAAKQRVVNGRQLAPSTLGATIDWTYDVNAAGVGFAVWVDGNGDRRRVLAARRSPDGAWSRATRLTGLFPWSGKRGYAGYPDVAVDSKGRATVVWVQPDGPGVRVRAVTWRGKGWSRPRNLSARKDFAGFPDVEVSDRGHAVVAWAGGFTPTFSAFTLLTAYRQPNGDWSGPERLDTATTHTLDARPGSIAIDDRGVASLAWDEIGGTDRIRFASRAPDSGWVQATLAEELNLNSPEVATTAGGQLVVAWRNGEALFAQERSAAGAWTPVQQVSNGPAGTVQNLYGVAINEKGRVALLGRLVDLGSDRIRPYVVVRDGAGAPWRREYVSKAFRQLSFDAFEPELLLSRRGRIAVTWNVKPSQASPWYRTYARVRDNDGRWGAALRVGRTSDNPVLGVDGKERLSMVFGEGDGYLCCVSLRYAALPG